MTYAPIVVFGFNRPDALRNTIDSLLHNKEAKFSDLYVFVDGPREGKVGEKEKVDEVRKYVKSIKGFHTIHYSFSDINKGLANSIISGVSKITWQETTLCRSGMSERHKHRRSRKRGSLSIGCNCRSDTCN